MALYRHILLVVDLTDDSLAIGRSSIRMGEEPAAG